LRGGFVLTGSWSDLADAFVFRSTERGSWLTLVSEQLMLSARCASTGRQPGSWRAFNERRRVEERARRHRALIRGAVLFLLFAGLITSSTMVAGAHTPLPTDGVVEAYVTARIRGDSSALLAMMAHNAIVTEPNGRTYTNAQDIREWVQRRTMRRPESIVIAERQQFREYISWAEQVYYVGSVAVIRVQAIVRDGLISSLAYGDAPLRDPLDELDPSQRSTPDAIGPGILASSIVVGAVLLTLYTPRGDGGPRPARGRLLPRLRQWQKSRLETRLGATAFGCDCGCHLRTVSSSSPILNPEVAANSANDWSLEKLISANPASH